MIDWPPGLALGRGRSSITTGFQWMIGPCSGLLGGPLAGGGLGYGDDWISMDDIQAKFDDERISMDERQAQLDGDWT